MLPSLGLLRNAAVGRSSVSLRVASSRCLFSRYTSQITTFPFTRHAQTTPLSPFSSSSSPSSSSTSTPASPRSEIERAVKAKLGRDEVSSRMVSVHAISAVADELASQAEAEQELNHYTSVSPSSSSSSSSSSPTSSSTSSPSSSLSLSSSSTTTSSSSLGRPYAADEDLTPVERVLRRIHTYSQLGKPSLTALVVVTTAAGFVLPGHPMSLIWFQQLACTVIGTTMTAISANTYNMIYEKDLDKRMSRTANRPLPSGRLSVRQATNFCLFNGIGGVALLAATANPLTAALGATTLFLYTHVYTPMKQKSTFNTYVGSVVGAIPPVMGWTAATGSLMAMEPAILFSTLFLWQLPHFASIAWLYRRDYKQAGYEMWSKYDRRGRLCYKISAVSIGLMTAIPVVTYVSGCSSVFFLLTGLGSLGIMVRRLIPFGQHASNKNVKSFMLSTLIFLPVFLALWYADVFWNKCWDAFHSLASQVQQYLTVGADVVGEKVALLNRKVASAIVDKVWVASLSSITSPSSSSSSSSSSSPSSPSSSSSISPPPASPSPSSSQASSSSVNN